MHSSISENQFMIHILNYLTSDYKLQLAMSYDGKESWRHWKNHSPLKTLEEN
jgi:hypothetical protein